MKRNDRGSAAVAVALAGSNAAPLTLAHGLYALHLWRPRARVHKQLLVYVLLAAWKVSYLSIGDENSQAPVPFLHVLLGVCNTHWTFDGEYSTTLARQAPYLIVAESYVVAS